MDICRLPLFRSLCPDSVFIRVQYKFNLGRRLNLEDPQAFTEKTQWYKLNYRNPQMTMLVDKYAVKSYVEEKIGKEHVIPLLVKTKIKNFDDIDFDSLPNSFVIKCTHDSASVAIVKDKSKMNIKETKEHIENCQKTSHFWYGREWAYKNVDPHIIVEQYMEDEGCTELKDYKFFCSHGVPKFVQVEYGRFGTHIVNRYTLDWEYIPVSPGYVSTPMVNMPRPKHFDEMLEIVKKLSADFPFVRVDLYDTGNQVYFGEFAFYNDAGFEIYDPEEYDLIFGKMFDFGITGKK